ncbi:MAG: hypothetical protein FH756_16910 [Firmicutes bacterium]|nr:hypothetical protein [Bacillota bacterium]
MRLTAIMPRKDQVGFLVDSLKNAGFDRKDMITTDLGDVDNHEDDSPNEVAEALAFVKTENDGLWDAKAFAEGLGENIPGSGIAVVVELPKKEADRVRAIMEQSGATKIMQD